MRRGKRLLTYRTFIVQIGDQGVECVTMGAVANALHRSLVHTRRRVREGFIPVPYVKGGNSFPTKRNLFPVAFVAQIERAAREIGLDRRNGTNEDWERLRVRVGGASTGVPDDDFDTEDRPQALAPWAEIVRDVESRDRRAGPQSGGDHQLPYQPRPGVWKVDFSRR